MSSNALSYPSLALQWTVRKSTTGFPPARKHQLQPMHSSDLSIPHCPLYDLDYKRRSSTTCGSHVRACESAFVELGIPVTRPLLDSKTSRFDLWRWAVALRPWHMDWQVCWMA